MTKSRDLTAKRLYGVNRMRVRIYKPAKSAAQAGRAKSREWLLEPARVTARTPEPLMGWVSAGDTFSELQGRMFFPTQAEAIAFANRHAWEYILEQPSERRITPRNYLDNFRITRPEDEERKPVT